MRPAPALASAEQAGELVEHYWQAVLRDVPFAQYESHPLAKQAAEELSSMSDFRGPKQNGRVTPQTLFRGSSQGGLRGPYVSQFLLRDIPMAPLMIPHRIRTATTGRDYMTDVASWLNVQNGQQAGPMTFEDSPRYIRNGRDLGEYVHRDFTYQAGLCATIMLLKMSAPLDGGIPYQYSITQGGFVTFGPSDIFHLVATVANLALKPTWYHKWLIHRRARPEELAGRLHFRMTEGDGSPFHRDVLNASVLKLIHSQHGTYLLPQAYPEGAPSHPSYPAGHAVIAGAMATVLKAVFNESWELPKTFVPSNDGKALANYSGGALTVGGELDKLAENIANSRNVAGVHWRSDGSEGLKMGEEYAILYLKEMKVTSSDFFNGFSLTKFDGTRVTI
jgi:membrane-associated phospholipid phosphatase